MEIVTKINFNNLSYTKPSKINNRYISLIKCNSKDFYLQFNKLKILNIENDEEKGLILNLVLQKKHLKMLLEFEQYNTKTCHKNSSEWFGKKMSLSNIESNYVSSVKQVSPEQSKIQLIIPNDIQIYDQYKNTVNLNKLKNNDTVSLIVKVSGLLFGKTTIQMGLNLVQVKYYANKMSKYLFTESDNEATDIENDEEIEKIEKFVQDKLQELN